MKRTALALTLVLALLFSTVAGVMFIYLATANPAPLFPFPWDEPVTTPPTIVVHSPVQNQTYGSTDVLLNFSIVKPETWFPSGHLKEHGYNEGVFGNVTSVYYVVDGGERQNITVHDTDTLFTANAARTLNFSIDLVLAEGPHNVTVNLDADSYYVLPIAGQGWSLPSVVVHSESETVNFTVQPFPTAFVITASGASLAVVGIGLLFYFRRRKKTRSDQMSVA
jgi:hypothetical protein